LAPRTAQGKEVARYFEPLAQLANRGVSLAKDSVERGGRVSELMANEEKAAEARGYADAPRSAKWYFDGLPEPLQTVSPEIDGRFRFEVPPGNYVISCADDDHSNNWLVRVTVKEKGAHLILSNENRTSENARESLLRETCRKNGPGYNAQKLIDFVDGKKKEDAEAAAEVRRAALETDILAARAHPGTVQEKAASYFPALRDAASPLNREFVARHKRYQTEQPEFFKDPAWPLKLAVESAAAVKLSGRVADK
jgi:hypothetical protein